MSLALLFFFGFAAQASYSPGPRKAQAVSANFMKPAHVDFADSFVDKIQVPTGFKVKVAAKDLSHTRTMILGAPGVIYASDPAAGAIYSFKDNPDGTLTEKKVIASGIDKVNGMILHEGNIYFVAVQKIYVYEIQHPEKPPRVIVDGLPSGGQHGNRMIHEGPDGLLYVSIGSTCNTCDSPDKDSATMQRMNFDGTHRAVFAEGLRDTMAFAWSPVTHELYGVDNGVDWRGDNIPPEKLNHIKQDNNYGWPFCWGESQPDPNLIDEPKGSTKEEFCKKATSPLMTFAAHSAPIDMAFYTGAQFPERYRSSAFVTMHGSWNRKHPSGYRVLRILFENNKPSSFVDFMTGFLIDNDKSVFGRPSGLLVDRDGSLLVSDDEGGVIYRVTYTP